MNTKSDNYQLEPPPVNWLHFFLFLTAIGLINFNVLATNAAAEDGYSIHKIKVFWHELIGAWALLPTLPFVFWVISRFPLNRENWLRRLPIHIGASIAYGLTQTMIMYGTRTLLHKAMDWSAYDYGDLWYRILMEYNKQALVYVILYFALIFLQSRRDAEKAKLHSANLEQELTKSRLQALQMQLNPHFLFNSLNAISSTMHEHVDAADTMLANLSDLLRRTLNTRNWTEHPFNKELELIRLYSNMMLARFEDQLQIDIDHDQAALDALVPCFILQPLVENAIEHGRQALTATAISISATKSGDRFRITIDDSGPGIDAQNDMQLNGGIGLSNTMARLTQLYRDDHDFSLTNRYEGGLRVEIDIPYRTQKDTGSTVHET